MDSSLTLLADMSSDLFTEKPKAHCPYCLGAREVHGVVDDVEFIFDCICAGGNEKSVLWLIEANRGSNSPVNDLAKPTAVMRLHGGKMRPVYQLPNGRQFVIDDDGNKVFIPSSSPEAEADAPTMLEQRGT